VADLLAECDGRRCGHGGGCGGKRWRRGTVDSHTLDMPARSAFLLQRNSLRMLIHLGNSDLQWFSQLAYDFASSSISTEIVRYLQ
jgi:hypothetical protein